MLQSAMTKIDELKDRYSKNTAPADQAAIFYLLKARVAAGLENQEPGSHLITESMGQSWTDAKYNIDKLAAADPKAALNLALKLTLLPRDVDPAQEDVYKWMRGDGPIILGDDILRPTLLNYLDSDLSAPAFADTVCDYIKFDMASFAREQVFTQPDCFLAVASIYMGLKTKDITANPLAKSLYDTAVAQLELPDIRRIIEYYGEESDTAWLAEGINKLLPAF